MSNVTTHLSSVRHSAQTTYLNTTACLSLWIIIVEFRSCWCSMQHLYLHGVYVALYSCLLAPSISRTACLLISPARASVSTSIPVDVSGVSVTLTQYMCFTPLCSCASVCPCVNLSLLLCCTGWTDKLYTILTELCDANETRPDGTEGGAASIAVQLTVRACL